MKLLFDHNLSPRLVRLLADVYPESQHVRDLGMARAPDPEVWAYAAAHGLTIASKDSDFHQYSFLYGPPPKVVWIQRGNCSTAVMAELLRTNVAAIEQCLADPQAAFLALR